MKIVTHGGKAHLDDLMSCAILLAHAKMTKGDLRVKIERREPTLEELADPEVVVLGIGGRYEPEWSNFDHHQLSRGSRDSAMTLLAANLRMPHASVDSAEYHPGDGRFPEDSMASFLETVFPWFRRRAELDSCGPFATAKEAGTEWNVVESFLGPCEDAVLDQFEKFPVSTATALANMIVRKWAAFDRVRDALMVENPRWADGKFAIADFTAANPAEVEEVGDALTAKVGGVAIFHDNRGEGLTLLRLRDDPRVDFTRVKDDPEVAFAHAGGFVAKTKSKDLEKARRLIEAAYSEAGDCR